MSVELKSISDRFPRLRRFAVLILVAGALAAFSLVKPHIPHDHPVAYRFDPHAHEVTDLEATWTAADSPAGESAAGVRFHFEPGTAPREVRSTVRGPDGDYVVEFVVTASRQRHRDKLRVTLGDKVARVPVPVPDPPTPDAQQAAQDAGQVSPSAASSVQ
jgi:hypothetical protein